MDTGHFPTRSGANSLNWNWTSLPPHQWYIDEKYATGAFLVRLVYYSSNAGLLLFQSQLKSRIGAPVPPVFVAISYQAWLPVVNRFTAIAHLTSPLAVYYV